MTPILLVVSRKLLEIGNFFLNKRLHTCHAVGYCPLEFKAGMSVFSTFLSRLDRRLGTICLFSLHWVSLQLSRNFSGFHSPWPTCIESTEIFAPSNHIFCFRAKPAVELILVHYITNAYLDFRTILKKFRSLWHVWASVVSCSHRLPLLRKLPFQP